MTEGMTDKLILLIPCQVFGGVIHAHDLPILIEQDDRLRRLLEQQAVLFPAFAQGLLCKFFLCYILHNADDILRVSISVEPLTLT